ncbi:MAG: hypothetical protein CMP53_05090 [Flavobacteriales bacterium]|nr:hypothetical protein [Flavobacteriales bacterium]|tara:strand:+ start:626 stop:2611 length:1986 start_codon:yes stop_codon:yes gene_type:complete
MRRIFIVFAVLFAIKVSAQKGPVELGNHCGDDHHSPTKQIQKAIRAMNQRDYPNATVYIGAALRQSDEDQHALYLKGELSIRTKKFHLAEAHWKQLVKRCPGYKPDLLYAVGSLCMAAGRNDEAESYFEQWLLRDDRETAFDSEVKGMLEEINLKETYLANPVPYAPIPARNINTRWDEYLGALTPDGSQFYFTRRSKKRNKYEGPAAPLRSVEEFSLANTLSSTNSFLFEEGTALSSPFNSKYNEGGPTITADNRLMVFTICERDEKTGKQNCDLYYSTFSFGVWNGIRPVPNVNGPNSWESQPSISPNGDVLYFTSNRKGGFGGLDLYKSTRDLQGVWSIPENLGPTVNTTKNEKSPFIHSDSESMYFASDGHPGMGGYDLFKSSYAPSGWGKPQNLGYPINTEKDEIGMMVTLEGRQAYFSSNKINKANGWDIYFFDLYEAAQPVEVVLVKGTLTKDMFASDDDAKVILKNSSTGERTALQVDEETGDFSAVVKKEDAQSIVIKLEAKKAAFSAAPLRLALASSGPPGNVNRMQIELAQADMEEGESYPIPNILFETNSDRLDALSEMLIAEFADFLVDNNHLKVQIQGHTDNVGEAGANLELSSRRAQRVTNTLYGMGIEASRLSFKGFGESAPVANNDEELGRAKNRRTVFVVTQL